MPTAGWCRICPPACRGSSVSAGDNAGRGVRRGGFLAACSSSTPTGDQPSASVAPTGHDGFAHCLSEHGVPAPRDPGPAS